MPSYSVVENSTGKQQFWGEETCSKIVNRDQENTTLIGTKSPGSDYTYNFGTQQWEQDPEPEE